MGIPVFFFMSSANATLSSPVRSAEPPEAGAPYLSIVIPVFNEQDNLRALHQTLLPVLEGFGKPFEVIYVDDGSADTSLNLLRSFQAGDPRIVVVEFSRNFGQH